MPDQPVDAAEPLEVEATEDTASLGRLVPLPWEAWNGVAADEQPEGAPDGEEILELFLGWCSDRGIELWPHIPTLSGWRWTCALSEQRHLAAFRQSSQSAVLPQQFNDRLGGTGTGGETMTVRPRAFSSGHFSGPRPGSDYL